MPFDVDSQEDRRRVVEALRCSNHIPVSLSLPDPDDPEGEARRDFVCIFESMKGSTDLNAGLLVWTEGKVIEDCTDEEIDENWENVTRPQWEKIACAQSVEPKFVTWEPRHIDEVSVGVLTDMQLTKVYIRIVTFTDTRINEVNPNLDISDEEWDEQFRTLGEAYIICKDLGIPLIEHCWMLATRAERQYALAVFTVGPIYAKQLRKQKGD